MKREKDIYYIDAIEDIEAYSLNVNDLVYLFEKFPEMERYARLSMGDFSTHLRARITSSKFILANERYNNFCKLHKDIYHRIPLGMIASYLGISQETLSRIRSKK